MKQFDRFTASYLYCPKCGKAMPTREKLLLVLPDGDLYDFQCMGCGGSIGKKKETQGNTSENRLIIP
jgi:predicted RNA-binding Zn-ribbon protein involved in translation (DUF1610 family)